MGAVRATDFAGRVPMTGSLAVLGDATDRSGCYLEGICYRDGLCQRLRTVFFRPGIPPVGKLIGIVDLICNETATRGKSYSGETPSVLRQPIFAILTWCYLETARFDLPVEETALHPVSGGNMRQ